MAKRGSDFTSIPSQRNKKDCHTMVLYNYAIGKMKKKPNLLGCKLMERLKSDLIQREKSCILVYTCTLEIETLRNGKI